MSIAKDFIKYIPEKFVKELDALQAEMNNLEEFETTLEAYGRECMATPKIRMRSPSEFFKEYRPPVKTENDIEDALIESEELEEYQPSVASEEESEEDGLVASEEESENSEDTYYADHNQHDNQLYKSKNKKQ